MTQDTDLVAKLKSALADWDNADYPLGSIQNKRAENVLKSISNSRAMITRLVAAESELTTLRADLLEARKRLGEVDAASCDVDRRSLASCCIALDKIVAILAKENGQ